MQTRPVEARTIRSGAHRAGVRVADARRFASSLVVALVLATSALACRTAPVTEVPPVVANEDTTLGAGDVFEVRVYGELGLSGTFRVAQDGTIDYPFVGRVEVRGLEPPAVADRLSEGLRNGNYLVHPQVSVMVTEYNSKRVTVMGAVREPGTFPLSPGLTTVQAVSLAGGFGPLANRNETVVTRTIDGSPRQFRVPVEEVARGRERDLVLRAGDIVFVPERVF